MARRTSLQDGINNNDRPTLDFYRTQTAMTKAIAKLQRQKAASIVNIQIRNLALNLQDVITQIQAEGEQAREFLEETQARDFMETPHGQKTMQDPRVGTMIREMSNVTGQSLVDLEGIRYPQYIEPCYIDSLVVPDLKPILSSLGTDIDIAGKILENYVKALAGCRSKWLTIVLETCGGSDGETDPATMIKKEWNKKKFKMDPFFPAELEFKQFDTYRSAMADAARSLLPNIPGDRSVEQAARDRGAEAHQSLLHSRKKTVIQYESALASFFDDLELPSETSRLYELEIPKLVMERWTEVENLFSSFKKSRQAPLRLCVFGLFNHGKSSFINALVGQRALHSRNGVATAWPIVVRHSKGVKLPILTIVGESFDPFIAFLRKGQFSGLCNPKDPRYKDPAFSTRRSWLESQPGVLDTLKIFENAIFFIPKRTESTKTDPHAVLRMVAQINDLVRLCWQLYTDGDTLPKTTHHWPMIDVEFASLANSETAIELLDCPGSGEDAGKMPDNLMEASLLRCLDGSFVIVRAADGVDDTALPTLLSKARAPTGLRPLVAYLTHIDELEKENDEIKAVNNMNLKTYGRVDPNEPPRVHACSPGLFINAHAIAKKIGVDVFDLKAPDGKPRLIDDGDWLPVAPPFQEMVDEYVAGAALKSIWGTSKRSRAEAKYMSQGYRHLKRQLKDTLEESDIFPVAEHFETFAINDGLNRRQFRELCLLRDALDRLLRAQREVAKFAIDRRTDFRKQQSDYRKFHHDAKLQWSTWLVDWQKHKGDAAASLRTRLQEVQTSADDAVEKAVEATINELYLNQRPGADLHEVEGEKKVKIETQPKRVEFLDLVQMKLLRSLEDLQFKHSEITRENARTEWEALMKSLASEISQVDPDSTLYARDEITSVLKTAAKGMATAVWTHLINGAEETSGPVVMTRIEKMRDTLLQVNLPRNMALAKAQQKPFDAPAGLDEVSQQVGRDLNAFGFMFRPCIPVAFVVPDLLGKRTWEEATKRTWQKATEQIWDDDKRGLWEQVASPADLSTVGMQSLIETISDVYVAPWIRTFRTEAETTLIGSIMKVREIAYVAVDGVLENRSELLKRDNNYRHPAFPLRFLHRIFTWHASCTVIFEMVNTLCLEWAALLDDRILPVDASSHLVQGDVLVKLMADMYLNRGHVDEQFVPKFA